ncbi:MAG: glycosyltransferase [Planctomycetota bacterium]
MAASEDEQSSPEAASDRGSASGVDRRLRVVRVLTRANLGGPARQMVELWHAHRALGVDTLLVTGQVDADEVAVDFARFDIPRSDGARAGHVVLPTLRRGPAPWSDRRAGASLRDLIRRFAPDVVHTHTSKAGVVGRRAARAMRVPVVAHTFHGHVLRDYFGAVASRLLGQLERRWARRSQLLFAVSGSCADELAELGVAARDRLLVVPPAVRRQPEFAERAAARQELGIPEHQWRVAAIGRLVPIKRLADFVAAAAAKSGVARAAGEGGGLVGEMHGDIWGHGPLQQELAHLSERVCSGRVQLRGPRADIAQLLRAYDAVVLPSHREGLPLVAVESFAAGVPVVGYDVPGTRDALADLGRGLLVPEADGPAGLRAALTKLRRSSALVDELTASSRSAVDRCAPSAVAKALLANYRRALAACGTAAARDALP